MTNQDARFLSRPPLQFYRTAGYPCSYLDERRACSLVAAPPYLIDGTVYSRLVRDGFRRSGLLTYRPDCEQCRACIPVRLPVAHFAPSRNQRRCEEKHHRLKVRELPLIFEEAHYALYERYQKQRHPGGGMDSSDPGQYTDFLLQSNVDTRLIEFSDPEDGSLRMVCIIDVLEDGLSSVYTFYDPDVAGASFGKYGILWQLSQCIANKLPYLYLGYWIRDSRKMAYKGEYRPIEGLIGGAWRTFDPQEDDFQNR